FFVFATVGIWLMAQLTDTSAFVDALAFAGPDALSTFDSILRGEVWRLITPVFIPRHAISVFFSSLFLLALGSAFEQRHRSRYMILLSLTAAAVSNSLVASMMGP